MSHTITLVNVEQAHQAISNAWQGLIKPVVSAGKRLTVSIKEEKRSLPQNDALQAIVRSIGAKINYQGSHDKLRRLLREQFNAETGRPPQYEPSWDGKRMLDVSMFTSEAEKPDCSEFIEWLKATEADL